MLVYEYFESSCITTWPQTDSTLFTWLVKLQQENNGSNRIKQGRLDANPTIFITNQKIRCISLFGGTNYFDRVVCDRTAN